VTSSSVFLFVGTRLDQSCFQFWGLPAFLDSTLLLSSSTQLIYSTFHTRREMLSSSGPETGSDNVINHARALLVRQRDAPDSVRAQFRHQAAGQTQHNLHMWADTARACTVPRRQSWRQRAVQSRTLQGSEVMTRTKRMADFVAYVPFPTAMTACAVDSVAHPNGRRWAMIPLCVLCRIRGLFRPSGPW
jgi:hypothetical protein